ncbi:hypothetical protein YYC_00978 [Plasmodium yoelii 17X]|uniref:Uncharacterized protein n=3 Tax=Plasmodium yoelii TaxID=5861 RepID=A0AAE9WZP5_PLAYO|nr:conserved protein, unknown function [Plasmodium yoelii]ETB62396.1 hypothetical protein YYC_00978 [Plasmodium yoelii 17X]WBY59402.1 hypothetical protein Py17XNL_001205226 [Plasmodium yoelii yoelii]CDU19533.1 conserved Plasmodium protein, unknown function [Plasmodium yoelii]VTZ80169.1 conserved protein, unknown function [Plasmodium yoelii]|eukprot:XP_022812699.1 conserved protein, unknown function [Plasmodium yoelii]
MDSTSAKHSDGLMKDQDMLSRELSSNGSIKLNSKSLSHISSNLSATKNPNDTEDALLTPTKIQTPETSHGSFDINEDKEISYKRFIQNARDEYSIQQMEKFLKHGIADNGMRMMTTDTSSWLYDYYKATKTPIPCDIKELTPNTTIDYYYYTTPFHTQIGDINLTMMHSQVNFEDGTCTPADRIFKMHKITPEMSKQALIKSLKYKYEPTS